MAKSCGATQPGADRFSYPSTARIQEGHILLGHIVCELVEQELGFAS